MKIYIYILSILGLLSCYMKVSEKSSKKIKFIEYINDIKEDNVRVFYNNLRIAYYKNFTLYEVPMINLGVFETLKEDDSIIKKVAPIDTTYTYFIVNKGNANGVVYKNIHDVEHRAFSVDSLLKALGIHDSTLKIYSDDEGVLTKEIRNKKSGKIEEERFYSKRLESDPDSIYRYFNENLNEIPFAFNQMLDNKNKTKLSKIIFIYNSLKTDKTKPRVEVITKIEEVKVKNEVDFISLFNKFEIDRKNLN